MEKPHVLMTDSELLNASLDLTEATERPYLTPERRASIEQRLNHVIFEMMARSGYIGAPKIIGIERGTGTLRP